MTENADCPHPDDVAALLRRLLDRVAVGDLDADAGTVTRLEGALSALDAMSGNEDTEQASGVVRP